jgi:chemotaxis family two-component system sensor kinase Cph1
MYAEKIKNEKIRKKAEEMLEKQFSPKLNTYKDDQYLYELRVGLIELEIQNKELIETKLKLEDSKGKYFDRFYFAPVAYFILDKKGHILDVNLAGAALLGFERHKLNKKAFIEYVTPEHKNKFNQHYFKALKSSNKEIIDLKLLKIGNIPIYTHLETINVQDEKGDFKELRIIVTDISDLKKTVKYLKNNEENKNLLFFRRI